MLVFDYVYLPIKEESISEVLPLLNILNSSIPFSTQSAATFRPGMAPKIFLSTLAVCVAVTLAAASPYTKELEGCTLVPDFIPSRIKKCTSGIQIQCTGSTVCYSQIEALKSLPCLVKEYPISAFFKMQQCGLKVKYRGLPQARICIDETELRKYYKCFNDGA